MNVSLVTNVAVHHTAVAYEDLNGCEDLRIH